MPTKPKDIEVAPYPPEGATTKPNFRTFAPEVDLDENFADEFKAATPKHKGYEHLARILMKALEQSSIGKGKERHATGPVGFRDWDQQPILEIGRMVGPGYAAGQIQKKVQEACTMTSRGALNNAMAEVLGSIVYGAALYKLLEEMESDRDVGGA